VVELHLMLLSKISRTFIGMSAIEKGWCTFSQVLATTAFSGFQPNNFSIFGLLSGRSINNLGHDINNFLPFFNCLFRYLYMIFICQHINISISEGL